MKNIFLIRSTMKKELKNFYKKNKRYIYIGLVVFLICILNLIFYKPKTMFYKLMNFKDIDGLKTTEVGEYSFLESYDVHGKINKLQNSVVLGNYIGDIYYVRGKNNLNIYQVKINTEENLDGVPVLQQIKDNMSAFEEEINKNYDNKLINTSDELIGESNYKYDLPIEESIYKDNRVYRKTYELKGVIYHINYYMEDEYLVCELIKFIK